MYKSEKTDTLAQDYLLNNLKKTLTDEDKDAIGGEITIDDIFFKANKSFANEKSPGCYGLTAEFYQTKKLETDIFIKFINKGFNFVNNNLPDVIISLVQTKTYNMEK